MKIAQPTTLFFRSDSETIAVFGKARLVRTRQGKYELQGGTREDRIEAREWISLFMHQVLV